LLQRRNSRLHRQSISSLAAAFIDMSFCMFFTFLCSLPNLNLRSDEPAAVPISTMTTRIPDFRLLNSSSHPSFISFLRGKMEVLKSLTAGQRSKIPEKPFRFLDLPAELRSIIYHIFFNRALRGVGNGFLNLSTCKASSGQILRTCRHIYREAAPILLLQATVRYTGYLDVGSPHDLPLAQKHAI
jgi:hypothetical protein